MNGERLPSACAWAVVALLFTGVAVVSAVAPAQKEEASGGDTTVMDEWQTAFGRALANLDPRRWSEFVGGKQRFVREWPQRGPWADAVSCVQCHYRDGRGPRPDRPESGPTYLVRLGHASSGGDPVYGVQLRRVGYGVAAPARVAVEWRESRGRYPSGEAFALRRPIVRVTELGYGALDPRTRISLRVPPAVFGLGLLEAVPAEEILARADPDDEDGDGVSGRSQMVIDSATGRSSLGRFGWKAVQPSLAAQSAAALSQDLGVTNPLAPTPVQPGDTIRVAMDPEIGEHELNALVFYLRALAVPARRRWTEPAAVEGEALFAAIGCGACHRQRLTTGRVAGWPELSGQTIRPYTDLLLHDMGSQLADEVGEALASGGEWRTPPLWGLGLLQTVSGRVALLHDGRARSPEEAILWHGGEAQRARNRFIALPSEKRAALIAFLGTL